LLGARIGHVYRNREELLEEKEQAERHAQGVSLESKIDRQGKRSGQLEKSAARDGDKFPEPTKQQVATLVNGDENEIEQPLPVLASSIMIAA